MSQQFTIQNDHLKVSVKQTGAEFSGLQSVKTGREYLWQADPRFWGRHSSLLFPIIGELAGKQYKYQGKSYSLSRHGFARNAAFELEAEAPANLTLVLNASEETKAVYPFDFQLKVRYQLEGAKLSIHYEVYNSDQKTIYFSLGAHPAFNCPLLPGEKRSDYSLVFEQAELAYTQKLNENGLRNGRTALVLDQSKVLPIRDDLFDDDALILSNLSSERVALCNGKQEKVLTFDFSGFPYLGIWAPSAEAPFVCLEPWFGVADPVNPAGSIAEKEGIQSLDPGATFACVHRVEINNELP